MVIGMSCIWGSAFGSSEDFRKLVLSSLMQMVIIFSSIMWAETGVRLIVSRAKWGGIGIEFEIRICSDSFGGVLVCADSMNDSNDGTIARDSLKIWVGYISTAVALVFVPMSARLLVFSPSFTYLIE